MRLLAPLALLVVLACAPNPAQDKPAASVGDPAAPQSPAWGEASTLALSPESVVTFVGSTAQVVQEGRFPRVDGSIELRDGDPTHSTVRATIDLAALETSDPKLTRHLKSADFFDVETYPAATFESTAIAAVGDGYRVTGNLDLHGVKRSLTFPATIEVGQGTVRARAEFSIDRFDFGISYPGPPDDLIRREVVLGLDVQARP